MSVIFPSNSIDRFCLICKREGRHETAVYHVDGYDFDVCWAHWEGNWDGWGPFFELAILEHLKENKIPMPPRNAEGWLPREYPKQQ